MRGKTFLTTCTALALSWALAGMPSIASAQERVKFPSADGELNVAAPTELVGYLYRPSGAGPFPAVVAMHGCGGLFAQRDRNRIAARNVDWGTRLSKLGYVVLFPDSFNPRGTPEVCKQDQTLVRPGLHRVADAYGALAWLQKQPFVRPGAIALMGWSHGGVTTVWASRKGSRARPKDVQTDFALGIAMYPGCVAILETQYVPAFPVHMFVGDRDDWTPAAPCKLFAEKAKLPIVAYPNAHHGFDAPDQGKLILTGLRSTKSGTATIGTDLAARADVIKRVPAILSTMQGR
jgi:dienelactone hydrolase